DFERLEAAAQTWLGMVFDRFSVYDFRDRDLILRSVPVTVSLGALGKAFYDGDAVAQGVSSAILADRRIDWVKGPHWTGVAGKVNANTGRFAVGGGKE